VSGGMQRTAGYGEQCGTTVGAGKRLLYYTQTENVGYIKW